MRRIKSVISLVMVLVLVLGFSVTVSADSQPTLSINGTTVAYTMPTTKLCPNIPSNGQNQNDITAADILLAYAEDYYNESVSTQISNQKLVCSWDQNNLIDGKAGMAISKYLNRDTINNYTLVDYDEDSGTYTYHWTGSYWTLTVDGSAAYYATAFKASDINSIDFTYIIDNTGFDFDTQYPINGAN